MRDAVVCLTNQNNRKGVTKVTPHFWMCSEIWHGKINMTLRGTHTRRSGGTGSTRRGRLRRPGADTLFYGRLRRAAALAGHASGGRFCGSLQTRRYKWGGREAWGIIHPFNAKLAGNLLSPVYRDGMGVATMAALCLCKFRVRLTAGTAARYNAVSKN